VPQQPKDFLKPVVVFVEGQDEVNVIESIASSFGLNNIESRHVGGKEQLATQFPLAIKQSSFANVKVFGIIQDADSDPSGTFSRITNLLKQNSLPTPNQPGDIVAVDRISAGVLVLPGAGRAGYLEDLFLEDQANSSYLTCARTFGACCSAAGGHPFSSKDLAHSLLIAIGAPETRIGRAFKSGALNANGQPYADLRKFLTALSVAAT
jgi:hypothetical protein